MLKSRLHPKDPGAAAFLRDLETAGRQSRQLWMDLLMLSIREIFEKHPRLESFRAGVHQRNIHGRVHLLTSVGQFAWSHRHEGKLPASLADAQQEVRGRIAAHYHPSLRLFLHNRRFYRDGSSAFESDI